MQLIALASAIVLIVAFAGSLWLVCRSANRRALVTSALAVSTISILATGAIAYLSFLASRSALRQTVARDNLSIGRILTHEATRDARATDGKLDPQPFAAELKRLWHLSESAFPGAYLCVLEKPGRIALHTAQPEMVGTDVTGVVVSQSGSEIMTVSRLLEQGLSWCGQNTNFRGKDQLVGYHYAKSIDSLVAVHVPANVVDQNFLQVAFPWGIGIAMVAGLLMPAAFGLMYLGYHRADKAATENLRALRQSESRFQRMLDGLPQLIWMSGTDKSCTYFNKTWTDFTGRTLEQEFGDGWAEGVHRDDLDRCVHTYGTAFDARQPFEMQYRLRRADGEYRWLLDSGRPWNDASNEFAGYIGTCIDITEQKLAEDSLRHSEERYRGFVENAGEGIYLCEFDKPLPIDTPEEEQVARLSSDCHFSVCNDVFARMYGYESGEQMLGMRAIDLYQTHDNEANNAFLRAMIRNGYQITSAVSEEFDNEGNRVIFSNNCLGIVEDGHLTRVWGTQRDITENRRAQEELLLRDHAFGCIGSGIVIVDATQEHAPITYCNPAFEQLTGYAKHELLGRSSHFLVEHAPDQASLDEIRQGIAEDRNVTTWLECCRKNGEAYWAEVRVSPVRSTTGELSHLVCIHNDITERIRDVEQLKQSEERYRSLTTASAATVWTTDADGAFREPQKSWEAFTGQPYEEHQGWGWARAIHQDDVSRIADAWRQAMNDPPDLFFDHGRVWNAADGEYHYFEVRAVPIRNDDGTVREWIGTTTDVHDREVALNAVRASEERLRAIVESEPECVKLVDANGKLVDMNPAGLAMIEAERFAEVAGTSVYHLATAEYRADFQDLNERVFRGETALLEFEIEGLCGTRRWVETHASPLRDAGGNVVAQLAVTRDFTDKKAAELQLAEQVATTTKLLETTLDGYILADAGGQIIDCNQSYCDMVGYSREDLLSKNIREIEATLTPEQVRARIERMLAHGRDRFETRHNNADGHLVDLDVSIAVLQPNANLSLVAAFVRDITERKITDAALRRSNLLLTQAERLARIGSFELCEDRSMDWSESLLRIFGFDPADPHPEWPTAVARIHPEDRQILERQLKEAFEAGKTTSATLRLTIPNEPERLLTTRGRILRDELGKPKRLVGVVQDVTEQQLVQAKLQASVTELKLAESNLAQLNRELEERVATRTAELKESNQDLEAFAHSVSHDLRAPLRAMEGFATALTEDCGEHLGEEGNEYVRHIADSARRMDVLINDLLEYSRLGRRDLRVIEIDLNSALESALNQLSAQIDDRNANVKAGNLGSVLSHKTTLTQILVNLLSNAIKFVAKGVIPDIHVWSEPADSDMIRVWVEDNGIGITQAHQSRVFQVFERLHGIESYPGTGIGLAIVQRACQRLNGRCGLESELGKGSRFWFELPTGKAVNEVPRVYDASRGR